MFCIYTGKNLDDENMSIEHIIPLSLGGNNAFTIKVGKDINSNWGSKIDGKFSADPLVKLHCLPHGNKGHSKTNQKLDLKGEVNNHPVTWRFTGKGSTIYDHIDKKEISGTLRISAQMHIYMEIRLKFCCKVALATGFFLFGEAFNDTADCQTLRKAITSNNLAEEKLDIRMYDNLHTVTEKDTVQVQAEKFLFERIGKSGVLFGYAPDRIVCMVAINGRYIGMVNFKANISQLPLDDDHLLGCVLICDKNRLIKKSLRQCMLDINDELGIVLPNNNNV